MRKGNVFGDDQRSSRVNDAIDHDLNSRWTRVSVEDQNRSDAHLSLLSPCHLIKTNDAQFESSHISIWDNQIGGFLSLRATAVVLLCLARRHVHLLAASGSERRERQGGGTNGVD